MYSLNPLYYADDSPVSTWLSLSCIQQDLVNTWYRNKPLSREYMFGFGRIWDTSCMYQFAGIDNKQTGSTWVK
jgi:hypothetical protein